MNIKNGLCAIINAGSKGQARMIAIQLLKVINNPQTEQVLGSDSTTLLDGGLPACNKDELKRWVHFAWRELREQNNTIPDDVLDFIRDAALNEMARRGI